MKSRIIPILTILCVSIILSSCIVTSHLIEDEISCDQFNLNNHITKEFNIEVGDKITVKLCSNPSTGFEWGYETIDGSIVKEEDHDFEEPEGDGDLGIAGEEVWTFEAVGEGATELRMEYSQPWEGGTKEEWTYTMIIMVK